MSKSLILTAALVLTAVAAPAAAQPNPFEGHWANPKHSMVVSVSRCGSKYCAVVIKASDKAKANARKGGTENFIGTEILRVGPAGNGLFKGKAFDPETNMHVAATVRVLGPDTMYVKGCALFGLVCEEQRWTKLN